MPDGRVCRDGSLLGPKAMNGYAQLLGARLKTLRLARRWAQKRVAAELGVSVSVVSDWERGNRFPSAENLIALAALFKRPPCQLLCAGRDNCPMTESCRDGSR